MDLVRKMSTPEIHTMDNQPTNSTNDTATPQGGTASQSSAPHAAPTQNTPAAEGNNQMLMGVLAYLSILVLIPLLVEKTDPFVKYHVKQGLVLLVIEVAIMVLGNMLYMFGPILSILNLGAIVLAILGIVNVIQKKMEPVPLVGQFSKHFDKV